MEACLFTEIFTVHFSMLIPHCLFSFLSTHSSSLNFLLPLFYCLFFITFHFTAHLSFLNFHFSLSVSHFTLLNSYCFTLLTAYAWLFTSWSPLYYWLLFTHHISLLISHHPLLTPHSPLLLFSYSFQQSSQNPQKITWNLYLWSSQFTSTFTSCRFISNIVFAHFSFLCCGISIKLQTNYFRP